jgi:hypothetical protein
MCTIHVYFLIFLLSFLTIFFSFCFMVYKFSFYHVWCTSTIYPCTFNYQSAFSAKEPILYITPISMFVICMKATVRWPHSVSLCLKMNVFKDIHNLSRLNTVMSDFLGYEHWVTCHVVWGHARCYNIQIDAWPFPYQTSYHPGEPHIDIRQQITCQADIEKNYMF